MKIAALAEVKAELSSFVDKAQRERVIITRHGRPAALLVGVAGQDLEDLLTAGDPKFWAMIEARKREPTISLDEAERRLAHTRPGRPRRRAK